MPIARYIFGRDKPSLTALAHGDGEPVERRRALGLRQLFRPVPLFGLPVTIRLHRLEAWHGACCSPACRSRLGCWS